MKVAAKRPRIVRASPRRVPKRSPPSDEWLEATMVRLRGLILRADPQMVEEQKWKKPSNPEGVPVWSHDGIVCIGNILKHSVRLTFPGGTDIRDPRKLFNSRLDSTAVRAIDFYEDEPLNEPAVIALIKEAVLVNASYQEERAARRKTRKH